MTTDRSKSGERADGARRRRGRARVILPGAILALVVAALLVLHLYVEITLKFEGRLWTLPSRLYSDRLVVSVGAPISREALAARLDRVGYVKTVSEPQRPGQYRVRPGTLDAHLRAFDRGERPLPSRRVILSFSGGVLVSAADARGRPLSRVEFEPELLALVFGSQQEERQLVRLAEVPEPTIRAVLAAEDARFFSHPGLDPVAIGRAGLANLRSGRIVQGGSTITQQTVKNLYLSEERTWWRKAREAVMSVILDLRYPKERILEVYLNEVYLGQRGPVAICGIQAASRYYFGHEVKDLSLAESATLAGLIRNPGGYNPFAHVDRARERRDHVLDAMLELGLAKEGDIGAAKREPLRTASGGAGFSQAPYLVDVVRSQLGVLYTPRQLAEEGLEVFTTVDTLVQREAEDALRDGLDRLERELPTVRRRKEREGRTLQGSVVVLDPRSGALLAMVGGRDYRESQFNRIVQAKRQPGSCFKPFVFGAGFEAASRGREGGLTTATVLDDEPLELMSGGKLWSPANYDGQFLGPVTARGALEGSRNIPTVRAAQTVGLDSVVAFARRCGIDSSLRPLPSLALGAQEVSPLELARAYATLANGGRKIEPLAVRAVHAQDGRRIERSRVTSEDAIDPRTAFLVTDVLRGVLTRGTAASSASLGFQGDAAGKTGTTDDMRDSWFVGYTPSLLALVWVGYDDDRPTGLTGATGALPIWVDLMMRTRGRWSGDAFAEPSGIVRAVVDPESGHLATLGCPSSVEEVFAEGTQPTDDCPLHAGGFRRWLRRLFGHETDGRPGR